MSKTIAIHISFYNDRWEKVISEGVRALGYEPRFLNTDQVTLEDIRDCVGQQVEKNMDIAAEGLRNNWGANVGSVILRRQVGGVEKIACAWAAAGYPIAIPASRVIQFL